MAASAASGADMAITVTRQPGRSAELLRVALDALGRNVCKVGWFSSSKYPDGTQVAYVASIHEFGYAPKNIPPRMGLREMANEQQGKWSKVAEQGAKNVVRGEMTAVDALTLIGAVAEADIRKQIASVTSPPLKEATILARQNRSSSGETRTATGAKPLVDTGYMLATATHLVTENKGDE